MKKTRVEVTYDDEEFTRLVLLMMSDRVCRLKCKFSVHIGACRSVDTTASRLTMHISNMKKIGKVKGKSPLDKVQLLFSISRSMHFVLHSPSYGRFVAY